MADWQFEFCDGTEPDPADPVMVGLERRLEAQSGRAAQLQSELQRELESLVALVQEASDAGMAVGRIASFASMSRDDVQRILNTGRLY